MTIDHETEGDRIRSLFWTFLKIGGTAFGGFMALISVVEQYAVERRKLLKHEDMLNGISLATILPGPIAVNVVAYVGYRVRGRLGALVSVVGVILPSFLMVVCLSYVYFQYGQVPALGRFLKGFIPAVSAIIIAVSWSLGKKTIKGPPEAIIAVFALVLLLCIGGFLVTVVVLVAGGLLGWVLFRERDPATPNGPDEGREEGLAPGKRTEAMRLFAAAAASTQMLTLNAALVAKLFLVFSAVSVLLFGGGYVFIPLIQHVVVDTYGWVSNQEFIDALALGQVTPGPIAIGAAFIGFKVAGLGGAVAATAGIFGPPAVVMVLGMRFLDRIKNSKNITAGLHGIRSAIIGMIAAAAVVVARSSEPSLFSLLIFIASLVALVKWKRDTALIILSAGVFGLAVY